MQIFFGRGHGQVAKPHIAENAQPAAGERGALWSAAMLLDEGTVEVLARRLERSVAEAAPLGITTYLETPRAPFSFV